MKRILFGIAALSFSALVGAQQACTVKYITECETKDGNDCGRSEAEAPALPMADVLDNADKFRKILDLASLLQDKGGPYTLEMYEERVCDGGAAARAQGVQVQGVTADGQNKLARAGLKQADPIIARYEGRVKKGHKELWDHKKAKKVKRNDVGKRVKDDDDKPGKGKS